MAQSPGYSTTHARAPLRGWSIFQNGGAQACLSPTRIHKVTAAHDGALCVHCVHT